MRKGKGKRLNLYPVKVAALLIIPSIALYLFFSLWPLTYSVYIAFTDANATNIASGPKIQHLLKLRESLKNYLIQNKPYIINQTTELERDLRATVSDLRMLRSYLSSVTPSNYSSDKLSGLRNSVTSEMLEAVNIINSNKTLLYYYPELRELMTNTYTLANSMWSTMDNLLGFQLFPSQETLDKVRNSSIPLINQMITNLNQAISIVTNIEGNYNTFVKIALRDVDSQINRLSVHFVGLGNVQKLFSDARFPYSILKTLAFVLTSVPLKVAVGVLLAFIFSTPMMLGRKAMRTALLIPWALPVLLTVTTWRMLYVPGQGPLAGLFSAFLGYNFNIYTHEWDAFTLYNIVEMWLAYPFIMTVTMGAIAGVPKELIEAAYVDGASMFTRFVKIMLPLTARPILFATILTTGASLQAFMVPLLVNTGGPAAMISLPSFRPALGNTNEMMVLYGYDRAWLDQQYGLSGAVYLIVVLILLIYVAAWYYLIYKRGGQA